MRNALPDIFVSKSDFERLSALAFHSNAPTAEELEEELGRATIVEDADLPTDAVTMNTTVEFRDLAANTTTQVTLVYPEQASADNGAVSILAPIGMALLGLRLNDVIEWPMPGGFKRQLRVERIQSRTAQPA